MEKNNEPDDLKETDLGILPKSWEVERLINTTDIKQGRVLSTDSFEDKGFPVFGANGQIGFYREYTHSDSEVLVTCRGSTCGVVNTSPPKSFITNNAMVVSPLEEKKLSKLFLAFTLERTDFRPIITGSGQPQITKGKLAELLIPLPPLSEQKNIAAVLSAVQEAKEKTEAVIEASKQLKKSLMKHLFTYGPVPLDEAENVPLKETDEGITPQHWRTISLGELCNFKTGKLNSESATDYGEYPFFTCSQKTYRIDSFSFDQEALLLAGNNARGIYSVKYYKGKFDAYQRTYIITIRDTNEIGYEYLLHELGRQLENLRKRSLGSTTQYLTAGIIRSLNIIVPNRDEQEKISEALSSIDLKIEKEEDKKDCLEELFKTLLHNLMTGKIRVDKLELNS